MVWNKIDGWKLINMWSAYCVDVTLMHLADCVPVSLHRNIPNYRTSYLVHAWSLSLIFISRPDGLSDFHITCRIFCLFTLTSKTFTFTKETLLRVYITFNENLVPVLVGFSRKVLSPARGA